MTRLYPLSKLVVKTYILPVLLASPLLCSPAEPTISRSEPVREGGAWVQVLDCGTPVQQGGRLELRTDCGSILVRKGGGDRLGCTVRLSAYTGNAEAARRYFREFDLSIHSRPTDTILLESHSAFRHRGNERFNADFSLTVPDHYHLDLQTLGGNVVVMGLGGDLRAETAGGDIRVGDITGAVRVQTEGGNISLGNIGRQLQAGTSGGSIRVGDVGGNVFLDTSGGDIVAGKVSGSFRAETAGGDILLRSATGPVVAETAGGQIQLGDCGATVRAQTAAGNIRLQGARGMVHAETAGGSIDLFRLQSAVRAQTAAGPILAEINATRNTFAPSNLETAMGDVEVFLPPDLPLDINAVIDQATGRAIQSDFPINIQGNGDNIFGARTVRGRSSVNGGGKPLLIRTAVGSIQIHKLDSQALQNIKRQQQELWHHSQQFEEAQIKQQMEQLERIQQKEMIHVQEQLKDLRERLQQQLHHPDDDDDD